MVSSTVPVKTPFYSSMRGIMTDLSRASAIWLMMVRSTLVDFLEGIDGYIVESESLCYDCGGANVVG